MNGTKNRIFREKTTDGKVAVKLSLEEIRTIRLALNTTANLLQKSWRIPNPEGQIGEKESWCRDLLKEFPKGEIV